MKPVLGIDIKGCYKTQRFQVRFDVHTAKWIRSTAEQYGMCEAQFLRNALYHYKESLNSNG